MHDDATALEIRPTDPADAAARALIAESDAYLATLYPAESNHLESVAALARPGVRFLGAWRGGRLVGCGAVKRLAGAAPYGEIKRVYVPPVERGRGLATALMHALEQHLLASGIGLARLETGIRQPQALALYRRLGYVERGPFGDYAPDPLSVFLEKRLQP